MAQTMTTTVTVVEGNSQQITIEENALTTEAMRAGHMGATTRSAAMVKENNFMEEERQVTTGRESLVKKT